MNPIETAAEALVESRYGRNLGLADRPGVAQDVFASLAQHRDDIARAMSRHLPTNRLGLLVCACGEWPYDEGDDQTWDGLARHQADAVLAYLTGEAS